MTSNSTCATWRHPLGCTCQACVETGPSGLLSRHPFWRERKLMRRPSGLPPANYMHQTTCTCGCHHCNGNVAQEMDEHRYWRERNRSIPSLGTKALGGQALEILLETPIVHLVSGQNAPVSALPGLYREFEEKPLHHAAASKVRIVYVYAPNPSQLCVRPRKWQTSEQYVANTYQNQKRYAAKGQTQITQKGTISRPDGVLSPKRQSWGGMQLPLPQTMSKQELELVEVKRYRTENIPTLFNRLVGQVKTRASMKAPNGATGRFQTIVLDFRGQEAQCDKIKAAAQKVAERLKSEVRGVTILVQVLLWSGPNCHRCQGVSQTL